MHVAARIRPIETIWATAEGGPMAMLPLTVGAVDIQTLQPVMQNVEISSSAALLSAPIFRMLSLTLQHPGNAEEIARSYAPRLLAYLLAHLVCVPAIGELEKSALEQRRTEERDEELVVAVVALAQAPKDHVALKVQLYSSLLLDLKLWSSCSYGLQKKLLSTLADMVFTESETMRGANAIQMLLDGCRRCYWLIPELDSVHAFAGGRSSRPAGELNALVDELLVVVELLVGSSAYEPSLYTDVCSLVQFVLDCPQPNQVPTSTLAPFAVSFVNHKKSWSGDVRNMSAILDELRLNYLRFIHKFTLLPYLHCDGKRPNFECLDSLFGYNH